MLTLQQGYTGAAAYDDLNSRTQDITYILLHAFKIGFHACTMNVHGAKMHV